jgi:hypothetical protein
MAIQMGLGKLGTASTVFKRKFRWTMEFENVCYLGQNVKPHFVKAANRPTLAIDETEINFLNGKMFIPGKGTPENTTVTYYDVASADAAADIGILFNWLATVYNFTNAQTLEQSSLKGAAGSYTAQYGVLTMYDGCGEAIDKFTYLDPWPTNMAFGDLDYSASEECTIELTLRYSNFEYESLGQCAPKPVPSCGGCSGQDTAVGNKTAL